MSPPLFERAGRQLGEWIVELLDAERAIPAGAAITMMACGLLRPEAGLEESRLAEACGFADAVRESWDSAATARPELAARLRNEYLSRMNRHRRHRWIRFHGGDIRPEDLVVPAIAAVLTGARPDPASTEILSDLIRMIESDHDDGAETFAAEVVAKMGPVAAPATEALLKVARTTGDPRPSRLGGKVHWPAPIRALAAISLGEPSIVERAIAIAANRDDSAYLGAMCTLQALGHRARSALPWLMALVAHEEEWLAWPAICACREIVEVTDTASINKFKALLPVCPVDVRRFLVEALRALRVSDEEIAAGISTPDIRTEPIAQPKQRNGPEGAEEGDLGLPCIAPTDALQGTLDADPAIRAAAARTISRAAIEGKLQDRLFALTRDPVTFVRFHAIQALAEVRGRNGDRYAAAMELINDRTCGDFPPAVPAIRLLGSLGAEAARAVPTLLALLDDPDRGIDLDVIEALGAIGPAAVSALPALQIARSYLEEPDPRFERAIARIRGVSAGEAD